MASRSGVQRGAGRSLEREQYAHAHARASAREGDDAHPFGIRRLVACRFSGHRARAREAGFSRVKKLARLASRLFEQALDPPRHLFDLSDTDPVGTVKLFHRVCCCRVNPV